jgi:membrane-associated phospholipid phosphatase
MEVEEFLSAAVAHLGAHAMGWFVVALTLLLMGVAALYVALRHPRLRLWENVPAAYVLVIRLAAGFLLIVACAFMFAEVADEIEIGEDLAHIDATLSQGIQKNTSPAALRVFAWLTHFGDTLTFTVLGIAGAITLYLLRQRLLMLGWIMAVVGNSLLNRSLKAVFERNRPFDEHGLPLIDGWSFPSGHASGSVVVYGMLGYVLIRNTPPRWHLPIVLVAAAIAFTTGCSRVFLNYHYASDVFAGFVSGTAWLAVSISTMEIIRWRRSPK